MPLPSRVQLVHSLSNRQRGDLQAPSISQKLFSVDHAFVFPRSAGCYVSGIHRGWRGRWNRCEHDRVNRKTCRGHWESWKAEISCSSLFDIVVQNSPPAIACLSAIHRHNKPKLTSQKNLSPITLQVLTLFRITGDFNQRGKLFWCFSAASK
jgi:hypothetical protein